ncbi:MAG TPA: GDP-mannose 4,6-dehydratase [Candidatus Saccharimonadales bacterium]|nr:GDP-mannose 4,6-dehydratase [Candidatus Saccharimonadales bacterium]
MKVLVTGACGFAGKHLVKRLLSQGDTVFAVGTSSNPFDPPVKYYQINLLEAPAVASGIDFTHVDGVYHLAGLAAVGPSFRQPVLYLRTNTEIQLNLFEACLEQKAFPKFLVVSSANVYCSTSQLPLSEGSKVLPVSPYALSKLAQEDIADYYTTRGFEVIIARAFNHMGPGQAEGFIVADLAKQIAQAEKSDKASISVGNLDAKRDYTDVRDIVRAYTLLMQKVSSGTYNVCSGRSVAGHEILEILLAKSRRSMRIKVDKTRLRPSDTPNVYGSNQKIRESTEWEPLTALEQTLQDVLADWRKRT